tara:strand:- start:572 stop:865 length:294 start_codon:yes stop_codon:yes gene_type:complete
MNRITKEEVKKVSELAKIKLNDKEVDNHVEQLEKILDFINQLEKIDTTNIPCTTRAIEVINVFRVDENNLFNGREDLLNLSPSIEKDFYKVPKIIKD